MRNVNARIEDCNGDGCAAVGFGDFGAIVDRLDSSGNLLSRGFSLVYRVILSRLERVIGGLGGYRLDVTEACCRGGRGRCGDRQEEYYSQGDGNELPNLS